MTRDRKKKENLSNAAGEFSESFFHVVRANKLNKIRPSSQPGVQMVMARLARNKYRNS